jgi:hypothetical protein
MSVRFVFISILFVDCGIFIYLFIYFLFNAECQRVSRKARLPRRRRCLPTFFSGSENVERRESDRHICVVLGDQSKKRMADAFKSRDIGLRAQKKLLGRMTSHKGMVKAFIDDNSGQLLDNLYRLVKHHVSSQIHQPTFTFWSSRFKM